jgi:hypothetical protein
VEPLRDSRLRDRPAPGPRPAITTVDMTVNMAIDRAVDLAPLLGSWVNFDAGSTGLVRVETAQREGALAVRAFGAGTEGPSDWGEIPCDVFTDGVGLRTAVAFTALYDLGFARVRLAAYLNKRLLVVDAYSMFHDGSGRSPSFQRDHFYIS